MKKSLKKALAVSLAVALVLSAFVQTNFVYANTEDESNEANIMQEEQIDNTDAKEENLNKEVNTNEELKERTKRSS